MDSKAAEKLANASSDVEERRFQRRVKVQKYEGFSPCGSVRPFNTRRSHAKLARRQQHPLFQMPCDVGV
jgi:hypothetical protein